MALGSIDNLFCQYLETKVADFSVLYSIAETTPINFNSDSPYRLMLFWLNQCTISPNLGDLIRRIEFLFASKMLEESISVNLFAVVTMFKESVTKIESLPSASESEYAKSNAGSGTEISIVFLRLAP